MPERDEDKGWKTVLFGFLTTLTTVAIANGWLPEGSDQAVKEVIDGTAMVVNGIFAFMTIYGMRDAHTKTIKAAKGENK